MPPKPNLRPVGSDERATEPKPVHAKISDALDGSSRDVLASMRKALAKRLDDGEVSSNAIASAYKELRELDRLIRSIDAAEEGSGDGEGGSGGRRSFDAEAI